MRFVLANRNLVNSMKGQGIVARDVQLVRIFIYVHTAWASCCLFYLSGDTRASISGTATMQSRFFLCAYVNEKNYLEYAENPIKSRSQNQFKS